MDKISDTIGNLQEQAITGAHEFETAQFQQKIASLDEISREKNRLSEPNAELQVKMQEARGESENFRGEPAESARESDETMAKLKQENEGILRAEIADLLLQAKLKEEMESQQDERNCQKICELESCLKQEVAQCRSQIAENQEAINKLESNLAEKTRHLSEISEKLRAKSEAANRLAAKLDAKRTEFDEISARMIGLVAESSRLSNNLHETTERLEVLTSEKDQIAHELKDKAAQLERLTQNVADLQRQIEAQNVGDLVEELKAQNDKLNGEISEKTHQIAHLTSELETKSRHFEETVAHKSEEIAGLEAKLAEIHAELDGIRISERQLNEEEENRLRAVKVQGELVELKNRNEQISALLNEESSQIEKLLAENAEKSSSANQEVYRNRASERQLSERNAGFSHQLAQTKGQNEQMLNEETVIEQLPGEVAEKSSAIESAKLLADSNVGEVAALKRQILDQTAEIERLKKTLLSPYDSNDLSAQVEALKKSEAELKAKLKNTQAESTKTVAKKPKKTSKKLLC